MTILRIEPARLQPPHHQLIRVIFPDATFDSRPLEDRRNPAEMLIRIRQGMLKQKWAIGLVWWGILHRNGDRAPLFFFEACPERHINERRQLFHRDETDRGCIRISGDGILGGAAHTMKPLEEILHKHRIQAVRMIIHWHSAPMFACSRSVALRGCTADSTIVPPWTQALEGAM